MKREGPQGETPYRESGNNYQRIELTKEINSGDKIPSFDETTKDYDPEDIEIYSEKFGTFKYNGRTVVTKSSPLNLKKDTDYFLHYVSELEYELIIKTDSNYSNSEIDRLNRGTAE